MMKKCDECSLEESLIQDTLIIEISFGSLEALHKLYDATYKGVYAFALSILRNPDEAEDVLQEVFLIVYEKAKQYKSMKKPMAWIYTITRNCCLMKMRKSKKIIKIPVGDIAEDSFFAKVDNVEDRVILKAAMNDLSKEESQIVMLHVIGGLKNKDIAELLKIPINTVLSKYNRALAKLREYIERGRDDGE